MPRRFAGWQWPHEPSPYGLIPPSLAAGSLPNVNRFALFLLRVSANQASLFALDLASVHEVTGDHGFFEA